MRRAILTILLASPFFFTACSTTESKASLGPRMVVSEDHTIFYRHMLLRKGVVVKLIKKEFLYSLVELSNGQKGYVANDSLAQAPNISEKSNGTASVSAKPSCKSTKTKNRPNKTSSLASSVNNPSDVLPKPSFRY